MTVGREAETAAGFVADFLGPEYDTEIDRPRGRPVSTYIVCSTPRSGSGLLSRGLSGTGALGTPLEYFNPVHRGILSRRWGCASDLEAYVEMLHARRTTPTGLFGAKVHWDQLAHIRTEATDRIQDRFVHETSDALIERLFPRPRFIRIVRLDLDSQAVSYWRSLNSGIWSVAVDGHASADGGETPYSFDGIDGCRRLIESGELCWDRLIRSRADDALVVAYEDLATAFTQTVQLVANYISPGVNVTVPAPTTRTLRNEGSYELLHRFRAERAARSADCVGPGG
jgi:trehalose 2-sulfotransferase